MKNEDLYVYVATLWIFKNLLCTICSKYIKFAQCFMSCKEMVLVMKNNILMQIPLKSIGQSSLKTKAMITLSSHQL